MRFLRDVSSENKTAVLVVTHDHRLIREVDRVVEMMDGRIVGSRNPRDHRDAEETTAS